MAQEKSKAVVTNDQIIKMLENDDKSAVAVISAQIADCRTLDQIESAIGQTTQLDRFAWIKISLLLAKIYETRTKKEASEANKRLQTELGYSKQQMSNFKKAGEKLLSGNYKTLKTGIVKFLNDDQKQKATPVPVEGESVKKRGEFTDTEGVKQIIVFLKVTYSDKTKKLRYGAMTDSQYAIFAAKGAEIKLAFDETIENGKTILMPTANVFMSARQIESHPLTSFKFVNL